MDTLEANNKFVYIIVVDENKKISIGRVFDNEEAARKEIGGLAIKYPQVFYSVYRKSLNEE